MSRRTKHIASGVDIDDRIHFTGRKRHDNVLITFGYPRTDEDVDYCLEDTPGLSPENFNLLKSALVHHLSRVRQAATDCVAEVEALLAQQIAFRALPALELDRRLQYVVSRFCKARKQILHKFRGYVRNRRWIENVATRQRRGCLTHRQNNILRLWLFSNFSNPYPDNEDKKKLIQQTHLNMTQINNWLINARSRVWKPTVETMSGERIRKEMNSKEGVRMELRASEMAGEYHKEGEYSTAPRSNGAAHGSHGECLNNTHGVSIPSSTPMNQTHGAQASTSGGDGISDEGAWLGPQNWSSLEFPSDALAN